MEDKETALKLLRYIENIEKFEEEKKEVSMSVSDAYKEAKAEGFDTKTIKQLIKLRKESNEKLEEQSYLLRTYAKAIQMELPF